MKKIEKLNFRFIKNSNLVEVWQDGMMKLIDVNESELFLSALLQGSQSVKVKSNVIDFTQKSWWQEQKSKIQ